MEYPNKKIDFLYTRAKFSLYCKISLKTFGKLKRMFYLCGKISIMKLQIDTQAKTIKVDENVKFRELIKVLKKILPDEWQDYSLVGNEIIYWYNPIPWYYVNPHPLPWTVTYGTGDYPQPLPGTTCVYNIAVMS